MISFDCRLVEILSLIHLCERSGPFPALISGCDQSIGIQKTSYVPRECATESKAFARNRRHPLLRPATENKAHCPANHSVPPSKRSPGRVPGVYAASPLCKTKGLWWYVVSTLQVFKFNFSEPAAFPPIPSVGLLPYAILL